MTEVQIAGIKSLIKEWCGVDIFLINAGPSVSDQLGTYSHYISFRDKNNNAIAIGITSDREIKLWREVHQ